MLGETTTGAPFSVRNFQVRSLTNRVVRLQEAGSPSFILKPFVVRRRPLANSATIPFSAHQTDQLSVDAIEEIKLRTWARKNYTEVSQRDDLWHPVILDEMLRIDQE
ncbi:hypothetical protein V6x_60550 [Gimesia chilikensis]|uniref:Uncharacterized protein n=1 Tax=Gimesia chilikensis TaxID=2605989 RepID=A0A517WM39_9PLAN|nr:hypothetical protein V6x_60550 [Gimesia chilikensis]